MILSDKWRTTICKSLSRLVVIVVFSFTFIPKTFAAPSIKFRPDNMTAQVDSDFTVSIIVDTAGYSAGGAGAIINYDPFIVSAVSIKPGTIFTDYPLTSIDNTQGKIVISGISSSPDDLFHGSDIFADIIFHPIHPGSTSIELIFEPNKTTDSNIAVSVGNGDVLQEIGKLRLTAIPAGSNPIIPSPSPSSIVANISTQNIKKIFHKLLAKLPIPALREIYAVERTGRSISVGLDPLDPIVTQPPITDPSSLQPSASVYEVSSPATEIMRLLLVAVICLSLLATVYLFYKRNRNY